MGPKEKPVTFKTDTEGKVICICEIEEGQKPASIWTLTLPASRPILRSTIQTGICNYLALISEDIQRTLAYSQVVEGGKCQPTWSAVTQVKGCCCVKRFGAAGLRDGERSLHGPASSSRIL
ncbi:hypothetical protein Anapl_04615 [Anas platyrhynchos]|uniref:Uncharacterized protein n=1 Tax=Anas platyrhynchos TaxID=8839 RepID=R0K5L3_ANAPL|nr:hypothetical protein Anapl_04615 [Anas platyrhynchos]